MKSIKKSLRRLMQSVARVGNPSRILQKRSDVSDSELYLMYALDDGMPHSQMQIAEEWRLPRTTLNTIVKRWEHEGLIVLSKIAGKRREKEISLTDKGMCKIKKKNSWSKLSCRKQSACTYSGEILRHLYRSS